MERRKEGAEQRVSKCMLPLQIFSLLSDILLVLKFQSSHCAEWPAEKRASKPDSQILYTIFQIA